MPSTVPLAPSEVEELTPAEVEGSPTRVGRAAGAPVPVTGPGSFSCAEEAALLVRTAVPFIDRKFRDRHRAGSDPGSDPLCNPVPECAEDLYFQFRQQEGSPVRIPCRVPLAVPLALALAATVGLTVGSGQQTVPFQGGIPVAPTGLANRPLPDKPIEFDTG